MKLRRLDFFSPIVKKMNGPGFLSAVVLGFSGLSAYGALIGDYQFGGDFSNSAGSLPSMTPVALGTSGFYPEGGWYWNNLSATSGLNVATSPLASYSLAVDFEFSRVTGYNKLLDFAGQTLDVGLYVYNHSLYFYGGNASGSVPVYADTPITIVLTRSATGVMDLYLKGQEAPIVSFTDTNDYYAIQNSLNFFLDDNANVNEFSPAGRVARIMIWDNALSAEEVGDVFTAIPEPMAFHLVAGAAAVLAFGRAYRNRRS